MEVCITVELVWEARQGQQGQIFSSKSARRGEQKSIVEYDLKHDRFYFRQYQEYLGERNKTFERLEQDEKPGSGGFIKANDTTTGTGRRRDNDAAYSTTSMPWIQYIPILIRRKHKDRCPYPESEQKRELTRISYSEVQLQTDFRLLDSFLHRIDFSFSIHHSFSSLALNLLLFSPPLERTESLIHNRALRIPRR